MAVPRTANSQDTGKQTLHLVQTISMPNVKGRLDHMDVDLKGKRLFIAGLENGSLEVVDLQSGNGYEASQDSRSHKALCDLRLRFSTQVSFNPNCGPGTHRPIL